jgi:hypothetical protein
MNQQINKIQILYYPGTFGNLFRFILDRGLTNSKLKDIENPFTEKNNVHQKNFQWSPLFFKGHTVSFLKDRPDILKKYPEVFKVNLDNMDPCPQARKIIITLDQTDKIFMHRSIFYRNPIIFGKDNIDDIIKLADEEFVKKSFKNTQTSYMVAKELKKIEFHEDKNVFEIGYQKLLNNNNNYYFNFRCLFDAKLLADEVKKISTFFNIELEVDIDYYKKLVEIIKTIAPIDTIDRCNDVLKAIKNKENIPCENLDIIEQAWIEVLLEKENDSVLFPFGTSWFSTTEQINEFLERYPSYLKQMNPRLPWYNNIKNPFYLIGKI